MMLPKKLKILGRTFLVKTEKVPGYEDDNTLTLGLCVHQDQLIIVNPDLHEEQQASILLHEWLEAVNAIMGLHLVHHKIDSLEVALYDLLANNKMDWVKGDTAGEGWPD